MDASLEVVCIDDEQFRSTRPVAKLSLANNVDGYMKSILNEIIVYYNNYDIIIVTTFQLVWGVVVTQTITIILIIII